MDGWARATVARSCRLSRVDRPRFLIEPCETAELGYAPSHVPHSWRVTGLLGLVCFVAYLVRADVAVAQERMVPAVGLTMIGMGAITAWGFQLSYALFQVPAGMFGERFGARSALALALLGCSVASFLTSAATRGSRPGARVHPGAARHRSGRGLPRGRHGGHDLRTGDGARARHGHLHCHGEPRRGDGPALDGTHHGAVRLARGLRAQRCHRERHRTGMGGADAAAAAAAGAACTRRRRGALPSCASSCAILLLRLSIAYLLHSAVWFVFVFWFFRYLTEGRGFTILASGVWGSLPSIAAFVLAPLIGMATDRLGRRIGAGAGPASRRDGVPLLRRGFRDGGGGPPERDLRNPCPEPVVWMRERGRGAVLHHRDSHRGGSPGAAAGMLNLMGNLGGVLSIWLVPRMSEAWGGTGRWCSGLACASWRRSFG